MRPISAELQQHLSSGASTVCTCWILNRTDGSVLGFTDHDRPLAIDDVVCEATTGLQPSEAHEQLGLAVDIQEVDGVLHSAGISDDDLIAGRYDHAWIDVWLVNWSQPTERILLRKAILGEVQQHDHAFTAELRGLTSLLDQPIGRTFGRQCDVELGSKKCSVDISAFAYSLSSSVVDIKTQTRFVCTGLMEFEKDWFAGGELRWVSGNNAGLKGQISQGAAVEPDSLTLWLAMPMDIKVGDQFTVTAGCDKSFATCKSKFFNQLNFRGCPHMPGRDFALGYVQQGPVHDGSPIFD